MLRRYRASSKSASLTIAAVLTRTVSAFMRASSERSIRPPGPGAELQLDAHHVAFGKQLFERSVLDAGRGRAFGRKREPGGDDPHANERCSPCHLGAEPSEADDAQRCSVQHPPSAAWPASACCRRVTLRGAARRLAEHGNRAATCATPSSCPMWTRSGCWVAPDAGS